MQLLVSFRWLICQIFLLAFVASGVAQTQTGQVFFLEGFEGTSPATFSSQHYGNLSAVARYSIQSEVKATGNSALKHQFIAGSDVGEHITLHFGDSIDGPALPNTQENRYDDIYVQFKVRYSEGFDWGAGNTKIMIIGTQDDFPHDGICCNPWMSHYVTLFANGSGSRAFFDAEGNNKKEEEEQWIGLGPNYGGYGPDNPFYINPGKWYTVEIRRRLNTPGQADGLFQMWVDGARIADYTDVEYRVPWNGTAGANPDFGTNFIMLTSQIDKPAPRDQAMYYDDIALSTSYIGIGSRAPTAPKGLKIIK